jgi:hypothetical protein
MDELLVLHARSVSLLKHVESTRLMATGAAALIWFGGVV